MTSKKVVTKLSLAAALACSLCGGPAKAQDVHFTQFEAAPLIINPAFTGGFDGKFRAAGIYRNQWQSVTVPYVTYGASIDMPIVHDLSVDDFLAAGLQVFKDQAGDANLSNFTGMLSVAYHKFLGAQSDGQGSELAVGLQGGYAQKSIDLSKLYFGDEFYNGGFQPGISPEYRLGLNNSVHYYIVNAGISWSQRLSNAFGYTIGVSGNNLNQPNDAIEKKQNSDVGLGMRYCAQVGAIINTSDRFSLRPAILYQTQSSATELIAGNEFHYVVGNPEFDKFAPSVFVGGWYRGGDAMMITAGFEYKSFRLGLGYDRNISSLNTASNGNGGFEISLRYIAPNALDFAHRTTVPCSRF